MKTLIKLAKTNRTRTTIPVLSHICIIGKIAHSTDMDMEVSVPCESVKSGMYYADSFNLLIDPIDTGIPANDFPDFKDIGIKTGTLKLDAEQLEAFAWVLKAASTEETRYYLNGIYFDKNKIVATDGHRLHQVELDVKYVDEFKEGIIMPSKCAKYLLYLHKEYKENVVINIYEEGFICKIGNAVIKSKHVDGTFPNYKKVFPKIKDCEKTVFDPQEIIDIKPQLDLLEKHNLVGKAIIFENGKIKPSVIANDANYEWESQTKIPFKIAFQRKYLVDMCAGILHYTGKGNSSILVKQRRGIKKTGILMPIRV